MRPRVELAIIILHYDSPESPRPGFLRQCLESISQQTVWPTTIVVMDDGSPVAPFEIISEEFNRRVLWIDNSRVDNRPQPAHLVNQGVAQTYEPVILLWSADHVMKSPNLIELGLSDLRDIHIKAVLSCIGNEAIQRTRSGLSPGLCQYCPPNPHHWGDNYDIFVRRADFVPFDEDFDEVGFGHQLPFWLASMVHAGNTLWKDDRLVYTHLEHNTPKLWSEQTIPSDQIYRAKLSAIGMG